MTISAGGKGDKPRPIAVSKEHRDAEYERLFGNKVKAGKFKADKVTGELIPIGEWYNKYYVPLPKTHFIIGDIEPYQSPVDSRIINSRKDHRDDLLRTGCRVYEGRDQEQREADRHVAQDNERFENSLGDKMLKVQSQLKNKNIEPGPIDKPISWTFGMD